MTNEVRDHKVIINELKAEIYDLHKNYEEAYRLLKDEADNRLECITSIANLAFGELTQTVSFDEVVEQVRNIVETRVDPKQKSSEQLPNDDDNDTIVDAIYYDNVDEVE